MKTETLASEKILKNILNKIEDGFSETDTLSGLDADEAARRFRMGFGNEYEGGKSKSVFRIVTDNLFTYFNLVFAIFAALLIMVKSYMNMTFLPVIIWNIIIGIFQEIKSKIILDRLKFLNAPTTMVIRSGKREEIKSERLVKGDLCEFSAGKQISADAVIIEGEVRANEALLTGEPDELVKKAGDKLYSGSFVVSGTCKAILTEVGRKSYVSSLAREAKTSGEKNRTQLTRSLDKLLKIIGFAIVPIGAGLLLQSIFFNHHDLTTGVNSMVAALVGMIPEGLYLLTSIALAVSVTRLAKRKVLVHELACVENLARVDVLCVDKTGTITENEMKLRDLIDLGCNEKGDSDCLSSEFRSMLYAFSSASEADNITMQAIKAYFDLEDNKPKDGLDIEIKKVYSFTSEKKYSACELTSGQMLYLGAPEILMPDTYAEYEDRLKTYMDSGFRILSFVKASGQGQKKQEKEILGFLVLGNEIRKAARETFAYFEREGVTIKVISGDNDRTASMVAQKAGIKDSDKRVSMTDIPDEKIGQICEETTVFGRVSPKQKKRIIEELKAKGHVVAMTGDGVNDVLAMKSADCSIAFKSGSDVASDCAQIVLLDSDFAKMPNVVLEGRRVVNNIQRSATLFLVKNIFSILMAIFSLIFVLRYPIYPTQMSLIGAFTIGIPGFLLSIQPCKKRIEGNFVDRCLLNALPAALTDFFIVAAMSMIYWGDIAFDELSTMVTICMLIVGLMELVRVSMPINHVRSLICIAMSVLAAISIVFFGKVFAMVPLAFDMRIRTIIWLIIASLVYLLDVKLVSLLLARIRKKQV